LTKIIRNKIIGRRYGKKFHCTSVDIIKEDTEDSFHCTSAGIIKEDIKIKAKIKMIIIMKTIYLMITSLNSNNKKTTASM